MADIIEKSQHWLDITQEYKRCTSKLKKGDIIKKPSLTLLESMSAVELMNPKMDLTMNVTQNGRDILSMQERIDEGLLKLSDFTLEELIGIIDETFACLTTWIEGNSIEKTIFTNLYLHNPNAIEDNILKNFCIAALKITDCINFIPYIVCCYDEEDFLVCCRGPLDEKIKQSRVISDHKICVELQEICDDLKKKLSISQKAKNASSNNPARQLQAGLLNRLNFTLHTLQTCAIIRKDLIKYRSNLNDLSTPQLLKALKTIRSACASCDSYLNLAQIDLLEWKATYDLGIQPDCTVMKSEVEDLESEILKEDFHPSHYDLLDYPTIIGFDPLVNHKLMIFVFAKCVPITPRSQVPEKLMNLFIKFRQRISTSMSFYQKSTLTQTIDQFIYSSKYSQPPSCTLTRSFMSILYIPINSTQLLLDDIIQSIKDFCDPPLTKQFKPLLHIIQQQQQQSSNSMITQLLSHSHHSYLVTCEEENRIYTSIALEILSIEECKHLSSSEIEEMHSKFNCFEDFVVKCVTLFSQVFTIYTLNTSRQQEKRTDFLSSFKRLKISALMADQVIEEFRHDVSLPKTSPLYLWTCHFLLKFSLDYLISGVDLELFSRFELPYVYWCMSVLHREQKLVLATSKKRLETQFVVNEIQSSEKSGKKYRNRSFKLDTKYQDRGMLYCQMFELISLALSSFIHGLRVDGRIPKPNVEYISEEMVFERRFEFMEGVVENAMNIDDLKSLYGRETQSNSNNDAKYFYTKALDEFNDAKTNLESILSLYESDDDILSTSIDTRLKQPKLVTELEMNHTQECLKVCKTNMVVLKLILNNKFPVQPAKFDFTIHKSFPTIRII